MLLPEVNVDLNCAPCVRSRTSGVQSTIHNDVNAYLRNVRELTLFLLACIPLVHLGQTDYRSSGEEIAYVGRNAIGLNFTPALVVLMAGESVTPRWSLLYRRYLEPNRAMRVWLNYEQFAPFEKEEKEENITAPGSMEVVTTKRTEYGIDLRAGMEWSKPDHRISSVYGLDVFAGWEYYQKKVDNSPYDLDTTLCAHCWVPSANMPAVNRTSSREYFKAGVDFSVGCLFRPTSVWEIRLQWTPEIVYRSLMHSSNSNPQELAESAADGLSFHFRGVEAILSHHF